MRASKAYIAGVGTTTVLVASALLLLVVVSTLVAFQGWPGTGLGDDIGRLVVDEPERVPVEGPVQVARNAPTAAAAVAEAPAPGSVAAGGPPAPAAIDSVGVRGETPAPPIPVDAVDDPGPPVDTSGGGDVAVVDPDPTGRGGLLPETPLSSQVDELTSDLGDTTESLTDGLGYTVGRLNPQLGQTVTDTGDTLSDLLRSLGGPAH